jgi:hypothetical protein
MGLVTTPVFFSRERSPTMRVTRLLKGVGLALSVSACYHVTVETGLAAGPEVINQPFASSFVFGLVPPATVQTMSRCRSGVARVETQQSFVNGLVSALTLGIYTPWTITVTCAAAHADASQTGSTTLAVRETAATPVYQAVFARAADDAMASLRPVYVTITPVAMK